MAKITFLGDIMCEGPFLNAACKEGGTYDFSECFREICGLLSESDYVIGRQNKVHPHFLYCFRKLYRCIKRI